MSSGLHDSANHKASEHSQHFIEGIGDGKVLSDFDLPDPNRRYNLRKSIIHAHKRGGKLTFTPPAQSSEGLTRDDDTKHNSHNTRQDSLYIHASEHKSIRDNILREEPIEMVVTGSFLNYPNAIVLVCIVMMLAYALLSEQRGSRGFRRKRSDRKFIKRTDSLSIRKKKKTDEWDDELHDSYCEFLPHEHSPDEVDISPAMHSNSYHYDGGNLYKSVPARQRKTVMTDNRKNGSDRYLDNNYTEFYQMLMNAPAPDEESPPVRVKPRANSSRHTAGSYDDMTPTSQNKQPIYVESFAQLMVPNLSCHNSSLTGDTTSLSVSDGNARISSPQVRDPPQHSRVQSGETEGANGLLHKRKDLTSSSDAASSLHSPIEFSDLTLNRMIGGGGFGQVWSASWRGTPVAVKILSSTSESENVQKAIMQEFVAEINMLSGMRHPNVCLYIGACLEPHNRAIVTELAGNGSLWDALRLPLKAPFDTQKHSWPLELYANDENMGFVLPPPPDTWPWALVKRVAEGAARGMNYLHCGKPPVLHRDLKSANILLDDSYNPKVCDFGLSRIKEHEKSMTANCGTVQWMAPEILANKPYAEPADVYSYGIILWELLTKKCPYDGMSSIQAAMAVLNDDLRPEIPVWCPPKFADLIQSCILKEPEQRPSFHDILKILDALPN